MRSNNYSNVEPPSDCPQPSDLSAWLDDEKHDLEEEHLNVCSECAYRLSCYRGIDEAFQTASAPPDGLTENVKSVCHASGGILHMPLAHVITPSFLKSCAAVLVVVFSAVSAFQLYQYQANLEANGRSDAYLNQAVAEILAGERNTTRFGNTYYGIDTSSAYFGMVDDYSGNGSSPARSAEWLENHSIRVAGHGKSLPVKPVSNRLSDDRLFPRTVHHVWVVDDLEKSAGMFENSLPPDCEDMVSVPEENSLRYKVLLSDGQLRELIRELNSKGWTLLSPADFNSEKVNDLADFGREVLYAIDIVTAD